MLSCANWSTVCATDFEQLGIGVHLLDRRVDDRLEHVLDQPADERREVDRADQFLERRGALAHRATLEVGAGKGADLLRGLALGVVDRVGQRPRGRGALAALRLAAPAAPPLFTVGCANSLRARPSGLVMYDATRTIVRAISRCCAIGSARKPGERSSSWRTCGRTAASVSSSSQGGSAARTAVPGAALDSVASMVPSGCGIRVLDSGRRRAEPARALAAGGRRGSRRRSRGGGRRRPLRQVLDHAGLRVHLDRRDVLGVGHLLQRQVVALEVDLDRAGRACALVCSCESSISFCVLISLTTGCCEYL